MTYFLKLVALIKRICGYVYVGRWDRNEWNTNGTVYLLPGFDRNLCKISVNDRVQSETIKFSTLNDVRSSEFFHTIINVVTKADPHVLRMGH